MYGVPSIRQAGSQLNEFVVELALLQLFRLMSLHVASMCSAEDTPYMVMCLPGEVRPCLVCACCSSYMYLLVQSTWRAVLGGACYV